MLASACGSQTTSGGSGGGDSSPYTFGVVTSQTGGASQLGVGELRGAQLAADFVNGKGGVNGHKIQIESADDQSQPNQALQQTRNLIAKKVTALVGPSVVANCNAIAPFVKDNGPVDYCLSPGIDASGFVWSASAKTDALAEETMSYWKNKGITRVAIINTTDASGTDGGRAANEAAQKAGVTVTAQVTYEPAAVSATAQLQQAMASNPQALVVWSTGTPVGVALKGIQQLGIDLPVMTTDGNLAGAFLERIADYTPKTLLIPATRDFWWETLPKTDPAYDLEQQYHDAYQQKYNEAPDFGPGVGYDAVLVLAEALKHAKSTSAADIRTAMESIDGFPGVVGTYHMSPDDHRGLTVDDVAMVQAENGKFTYVGK
ncbi:ABC transporter substrate-binding protein [Modestobacter sp. DSM 44400]|uniref:ABC transporter substrate-binding protein n=1 Tax=Modestobacter sp. DSM 44400 TaxID=1550230 RepID=UPI0020C8A550|nr:ABC transporter substrate-binding protein [Modestobacter sp. DSM 44400]